VALLAFVPIAVLALEAAGWRDAMARVIVLQAIAANLGGMVTPFGNPQNLFIFTTYELSAEDFFLTLAPFGLLAFVLLAIACALFGKDCADVQNKLDDASIDLRRFALHGALFIVGALAVARIVPYEAALLVVASALFVFDRSVFAGVDYALLATFVCFFIFSGNLAAIPAVRGLLTSLMDKSAFFASLAASQVISNVPSALLLSPFTDNAAAMILGTDVGGLGTIVASLASLISYKFYANSAGANSGKYLLYFTVVNVILLLPLIGLAMVML
jgi:Na+/H+ antiporter NhaD/arsenite permease-like protein